MSVAVARSLVVSISMANVFSSIIDGCLKYKNKEKPITGPRPGPCLCYDVKIVPETRPKKQKKKVQNDFSNVMNLSLFKAKMLHQEFLGLCATCT